MLKGVNTKSSLIQKGAQKEEDEETDGTNKMNTKMVRLNSITSIIKRK